MLNCVQHGQIIEKSVYVKKLFAYFYYRYNAAFVVYLLVISLFLYPALSILWLINFLIIYLSIS